MGKGLDIGTCFLVCASKKDPSSNDIEINSVRDAFLEIDAENSTLNMLKMSNTSYIQEGDKIYIVGENSVGLSNLLKVNARRPLCQGIIAPGELDAEKMLVHLIGSILKEPSVENEVVYYSVPAKPIDRDIDIYYHESIFRKIVENFGYRAVPMNEAAAIVYSNASKEGFTALATSCLTPGQSVITDKGFVNIEEIKEGYEVLNKFGVWVKCRPTFRDYSGKVYMIDACGGPKFEVTGDHLVWANREGRFDWIKAEEIQEGDSLLQPWDNFDLNFNPTGKRAYLCFEERITCSKESKKVALYLTDEVSELMGFWLEDGHLEIKRGAICFTQNKDETENIDRIRYLVSSIFGKDIALYDHGENAVRIKFYGKALVNWLKDNGYDSDGNKVVPWKVSELTDNILMHMLRGLIATDGDVSEEDRHIGFTSTSKNLAQFVYLALQRLGCSPTVHRSEPRMGKNVVVDHVINGKSVVFGVRCSGFNALSFITWMDAPYQMIRKTYTSGSAICRVSKIYSRDYSGKVYDLSVEGDDSSFCLPGAAIHNCGAGMANTALLYQTMIGMAFSTSKSGDWIDSSAAKAVGSTATRLMSIKEKGVDLLNPAVGDPKTLREREAIVIYYRNLIRNIIEGIKKEFRKGDSNIELPDSLSWIISGGTAKAKNFLELFKQEFEKERATFPICISDIRLATDPLNDVAKGLLIAAMNE